MCFNFSLTAEKELIEKRFKVTYGDPVKLQLPVYNAAGFLKPHMPVITNEKPDIIQLYQWGLIPFWVNEKVFANKISMSTLNARGETIFEKPSFKDAAQRKRCLVLADGFFEWHEFNGKKYPYYITLESKEPFAFAGLWDIWTDPVTKDRYKTFSIITVLANNLLERIHNTNRRMPAILSKEDEKIWLGKEPVTAEILKILKPYTDTTMTAHTVSRLLIDKKRDTNVPEVISVHNYPDFSTLFGDPL